MSHKTKSKKNHAKLNTAKEAAAENTQTQSEEAAAKKFEGLAKICIYASNKTKEQVFIPRPKPK